jgi:hypothetical protein
MIDDSGALHDQEELRWVESSGGPFVVLPASYAPHWLGSMGADYDAACEIDDYLGLVQIGTPRQEGVALIIADEPLTSTYLADLHCILQWQYAPSENALVSAARRSIEGLLGWHRGPTINFASEAIMFDAAASGISLRDDEILPLPIHPGIYECFTADYSEGDDIAGRLHQFRRIANGDSSNK